MISFADINKQYGKQLLFVDASFQLNPGEKLQKPAQVVRYASLSAIIGSTFVARRAGR